MGREYRSVARRAGLVVAMGLSGIFGACQVEDVDDLPEVEAEAGDPALEESLGLWAPTNVGDVIDVDVDGQTDDLEFYEPGATFIKLHLDRLDLAEGDTLLLLDGNGELVQRLTAEDEGSWTLSVFGERAILRLEAGDAQDRGRFHVDQLGVGNLTFTGEQDEDDDFRSICGADNKKPAVCFNGNAAIKKASRTVARLLFPKNGQFFVCTGALISPEGHFITNNHCIASQSKVNQTEFLFNFQAKKCNGSGEAKVTKIKGGTFLKTSKGLDYTLLKFENSQNPAKTFGHLQIASANVKVGTKIYIPQHPGGQKKEVAVSDGDGKCDVKSTNTSPGGFTAKSNIGYLCDTEGGSSGSPVLRASDNKMIALHHLGGCNNSGTMMKKIFPQIKQFL